VKPKRAVVRLRTGRRSVYARNGRRIAKAMTKRPLAMVNGGTRSSIDFVVTNVVPQMMFAVTKAAIARVRRRFVG
jgi:hypothetical protein